MKILSGSSHIQLAKSLAKAVGADYIKTVVDRFADQELRIQIPCALHGEKIAIVQSTSKPSNDNLMELLLIADACKRAGAANIIAVIPYFGYSRQDRPSYEYGPISASLVAKLLEAAGINQIITVDLHSKQQEGFFDIKVQNLEVHKLFAKHYKNCKNTIVVSPDIGGIIRAMAFSEACGLELAVMNKTRKSNSECEMAEVIGQVKGKHCVIIDDIVDTAGTLCAAADLLIKSGALSVQACITHGVLSGEAKARIQKSAISKILITNSIIQEDLPAKFKVISLDELLVNALRIVLK